VFYNLFYKHEVESASNAVIRKKQPKKIRVKLVEKSSFTSFYNTLQKKILVTLLVRRTEIIF